MSDSDNDNISYTQTSEEDTVVVIPKAEYETLLERDAWLGALEAAGVDNWDGYDFAQEIFGAFNNG